MIKHFILTVLAAGLLWPQTPGTAGDRLLLPNGWFLSPAGRSVPLGDLPLNIAVSPSKRLIAVTNNGQSRQSIFLIDRKSGTLLDSTIIGKSWYGLAFGGSDADLFASGGNDNWIIRYSTNGNTLTPVDTLRLGAPWPEKISPAGIAVDAAGQLLYVVTKENNSLYIIELDSKIVSTILPMPGEGYTCLLSPSRDRLYVSCWGAGRVLVLSTKTRTWIGEIPVGSNPNDLCLSADGSTLYVANSNDNSVSVINIATSRVVETLNAALYADAPAGSTTNSVALDETGTTLYIANADNNCLAVFDVSHPGRSRSKGFIPTGWYPTCVRAVGTTLFVTNGKGFSSMANPHGPNPSKRNQRVTYQKGDSSRPIAVQYIAGLFTGTLSIIPIPDVDRLREYSAAVYRNTPYHKDKETTANGEPGNPIPSRIGEPSPIKHVFYIIKENRTYDQVLGDMPEGNGDTSLVLFGERITPNQHALAREFVLLDNFYVNAEVSADGHNWSAGGYATDYLEKTWPTAYGGRGGEYDAEGNRAIASNKDGFIWDFCSRNNVSYRTYGEFADDYKPNIPALKDHFCPYFTGWDQTVRDTVRFHQWRRDFDSLLAVGKVPQFNTLRFINDHTEGLRRGRPTPFAEVADNDLAVGMFVDYLSRSSLWNESVVFILEDDAQNGPDHVDAHRSTAYVAGGLVKRGFVDHTMYSTTSVLRTIELILGLPPMSQYDAASPSMWRCFTSAPGHPVFTARPAQVDLDERNTAMNEWSRMSETFDFTLEDRAPDDAFSRVIWAAVKGDHIPYPSIHRAAFVQVRDEEQDEDEDE